MFTSLRSEPISGFFFGGGEGRTCFCLYVFSSLLDSWLMTSKPLLINGRRKECTGPSAITRMPWANVYADSCNPPPTWSWKNPKWSRGRVPYSKTGCYFIPWPTFLPLLPLPGRRWFPTKLKPNQYQESLDSCPPLDSLAAKKVALEEFL